MGSALPLLKWITLMVPAEARPAFVAAQDGWQALAGEPGFRWQVAGWAVDDPERFGALALWDSRATYDAFMTGPHDRLVTGQAGFYRDVESCLVAVTEGAVACPEAGRLRLGDIAPLPQTARRPELLLEPRWRVISGRA